MDDGMIGELSALLNNDPDMTAKEVYARSFRKG